MGLIGTIRLKLLGGFSASLALGGRWSLWAEEPGAPGLSRPRPGASGMAARSRWRGYGATTARLKTGVACARPPQLDGKRRGSARSESDAASNCPHRGEFTYSHPLPLPYESVAHSDRASRRTHSRFRRIHSACDCCRLRRALAAARASRVFSTRRLML